MYCIFFGTLRPMFGLKKTPKIHNFLPELKNVEWGGGGGEGWSKGVFSILKKKKWKSKASFMR